MFDKIISYDTIQKHTYRAAIVEKGDKRFCRFQQAGVLIRLYNIVILLFYISY